MGSFLVSHHMFSWFSDQKEISFAERFRDFLLIPLNLIPTIFRLQYNEIYE